MAFRDRFLAQPEKLKCKMPASMTVPLEIVFASRIPPRPREDQRPCGQVLCSSNVEAFVCPILDHWSHIGPALERLWGAFGGRGASQMPGEG
jgi:hypothetical protein